jgi:hypothetical protein
VSAASILGDDPAQEGRLYLEVIGSDQAFVLSQTLDTAQGELLTVSAWLRSDGSPGSFARFYWNGALIGSVDATANPDWTRYAFNVTATGADTFAFGMHNFSGASYADNLSVGSAVGGVPEPAAWLMMILGFGLAGGLLRARRRMLPVA